MRSARAAADKYHEPNLVNIINKTDVSDKEK